MAVIALFAADKKPGEAVKAINGRVIDTQGAPIAGARVWLQAAVGETEPPPAQATTDARGQYTLAVPQHWATTPRHRRRPYRLGARRRSPALDG